MSSMEMGRKAGHYNHRKPDKMKQQRNMTQTMEQVKTSEEQLREVEIGNQFETEFRVII